MSTLWKLHNIIWIWIWVKLTEFCKYGNWQLGKRSNCQLLELEKFGPLPIGLCNLGNRKGQKILIVFYEVGSGTPGCVLFRMQSDYNRRIDGFIMIMTPFNYVVMMTRKRCDNQLRSWMHWIFPSFLLKFFLFFFFFHKSIFNINVNCENWCCYISKINIEFKKVSPMQLSILITKLSW